MKANIIILILLLVVVAGACVVIVMQLSTPTTTANEDANKDMPDAGDGKPADGDTGHVTDISDDGTEDQPEENGAAEPESEVEEPKPPENDDGDGEVKPPVETPLGKLLKRFHEHQSNIKWMRADLTMTRFGIFSDPVDTDEQKRKAGRTSKGKFLYKPFDMFALTMEYATQGENAVKETERYLAYMHVLWVIKQTGDKIKAERWLIEHEKMYEMLVLLQGADLSVLKKTFDIRLIDLGDSAEKKRLKREGHDVEDLRRRDVYFLEFIYRNEIKRSEYKSLEVAINRDMVIEKIKLYHGGNDEESIIWFENVEINKGEEIPDSEFRFDPEKRGIKKFDDNATLENKAEILWRMQKTSEWVKGVTAGFVRDKYDPTWEEDAHAISSGHLYFMRPEMFRLDIEKPSAQTAASNGKKAYSYKKDLGRATVYDIQQAKKKLPVGNLNIMQKFFGQEAADLRKHFGFTLNGVEKLDGVECYHFVLKPEKKDDGEESGTMYAVDHVELWVELETFLARRIRIFDLQRKNNYDDVCLKNINIWQEIPAEKFDPVFPEGVEVIEE